MNNSDEHIIPDSINGRLHTRELICSECNQKFGNKLDPVIKESLQFVLFALGIGNVKKMQVKDQDGKAYLVDQEGNMKHVAPEVEVFKIGDQTGISVTGEKNVAVRAFAKKAARTFGAHALKLMDEGKFQFNEKTTFLSEVSAPAKIEITSKLKLAINKIITEFFAYSGLALDLIKERTERIFNLDESGEDIILCNFDQNVRKVKENEVSHLLVIRSIRETKQIYGYVELFNVICGYTVFAEGYNGADVDFKYHQNALTGEQFDDEVLINTDAVSGESPSFDLLVNSVLENARAVQHSANFSTMLSDILAQLEEDVKQGKISVGEKEQQYFEQATKLAAEMMVFGFPDDVADFTKEEELMVNYIHSVIKEAGKKEFEFFYHQLVGREFPSEDDGLVYVMEAFKYKKHVSKNGESRVKVYCYFKAKNAASEKYFPCKEIFDVLGLPPPPTDMAWV
ncbi:HNH endonuclease [Mucilaginibacter sp. X4EP1]|uniref:HNH endonuclease n=1 Tax=Mucilaginibacter sp. X4EP1 TaxID=2723092 RepID=UPI003AFFE27F|nr:hypothetical protein [Mucilaginibacter sp. X4EP1]